MSREDMSAARRYGKLMAARMASGATLQEAWYHVVRYCGVTSRFYSVASAHARKLVAREAA